jgi:hypothetical protein
MSRTAKGTLERLSQVSKDTKSEATELVRLQKSQSYKFL